MLSVRLHVLRAPSGRARFAVKSEDLYHHFGHEWIAYVLICQVTILDTAL
jgi:hypothetical protein